LKEPRFTNSREVWRYARHPVLVGVRLQVLHVLSEEGPMPLGRLLFSLRSSADPAVAVIYGAIVTNRLSPMGIRDKPIAPASPWQSGFAERIIGSIGASA
jgi:hypothetical protein